MRSTVPTVGVLVGMGHALRWVGELAQRALDHPGDEEAGPAPVDAFEPSAQRRQAQLSHVVRGEALRRFAGAFEQRDQDGLVVQGRGLVVVRGLGEPGA